MNKNDNILKKWWYVYLFIPFLFLSLSIILFIHQTSWTKTDTSILGWLIIFVTSIVLEVFILYKNKVKYYFEHYMFISLVILISIFISFIFTRIIFPSNDHWYLILFPSLLPSIIIMIIKTILWYILNFKNNKHQNINNALNDLKNENKLLKEEIQRLKINNNELEK